MYVQWATVALQIAAAGAVCAGFLRLFVESYIKERVKSTFDQAIERHKAALDLLKQKALKDFGLFAEKKHDVNTAVYSALRNAYKTISSAHLEWQSPIQVELLTSGDFEEFLVSTGAPVDQRRDLGMLFDISPRVANLELHRRLPAYRIDQAEQTLQTAVELAYTNELFLSGKAILACDKVLNLLTEAISLPVGDPVVAATLGQVPEALWEVKSSMRSDLLGPVDATVEPLVNHEEDFRGRRFRHLPDSIQVDDIADFGDRIARLVARNLKSPTLGVVPKPSPIVENQLLDDANARVAAAPNSPEALLNRARLLHRANRIREAEADARAVLANDPENADATFLATECYLMQLPGTLSVDQHFALGRNVIQPLTDYLAKHPQDARALHMRAYALMKTGEYESASNDLINVLDKEPERHASRALLADVYRRMGRTNEAINETDRVLAASPENLLAQLTRLELLAESHWWREVATVSPQALQISPDHPRVIRLYGTALNLTGRSEEVLKFDGRYKDAGPARVAALPPLAQAHLNLRNFEMALKYAEEALSQIPMDPEVNLIKAQSLLATGRWADAINLSVTAFGFAPPRSVESQELLRVMRTAHKRQQDASSASTSSSS